MENTLICSLCGADLHEENAIEFDGQIMCEQCWYGNYILHLYQDIFFTAMAAAVPTACPSNAQVAITQVALIAQCVTLIFLPAK